ncbi:MAG: SDR family NAD(P)-dependent oxidoreductase [Alphaproteobacteria bacterium]
MTARTIVVTGTSRGLGLALARNLAGKGHTVEGCSRSGRAAEPVPPGETFTHTAVDLTKSGEVFAWAKAVTARGHVPDLLVCNAGAINSPLPLWKLPSAEVEQVVATNVLGVAYTLQAFLPAMIERGRGIAVALSSGWGRHVDPDVAPYCASKFAVEGLTLALATELPKGLAAVTLNPGIIATEMLEKCWPGRAEGCETAAMWAARASDFILGISIDQNGAQLSVPSP